MTILAEIGANIQAHRRTMGLTQAQLAERLGVARSTIAKWEVGDREPGAADMLHLSHAMRLPVNCLYGEGGQSLSQPVSQRKGVC